MCGCAAAIYSRTPTAHLCPTTPVGGEMTRTPHTQDDHPRGGDPEPLGDLAYRFATDLLLAELHPDNPQEPDMPDEPHHRQARTRTAEEQAALESTEGPTRCSS